MKILNKFILSAGLLVTSMTSAFATVAEDATAGAAVITTEGGGAIATVGAALIGLSALALVYRWVKATFF